MEKPKAPKVEVNFYDEDGNVDYNKLFGERIEELNIREAQKAGKNVIGFPNTRTRRKKQGNSLGWIGNVRSKRKQSTVPATNPNPLLIK